MPGPGAGLGGEMETMVAVLGSATVPWAGQTHRWARSVSHAGAVPGGRGREGGVSRSRTLSRPGAERAGGVCSDRAAWWRRGQCKWAQRRHRLRAQSHRLRGLAGVAEALVIPAPGGGGRCSHAAVLPECSLFPLIWTSDTALGSLWSAEVCPQNQF